MFMPRVLWIEDGALIEFGDLAASVLVLGDYELVVATTASNALAKLLTEEFDAVIVDIRIPAGSRADWIDLFGKLGRDAQPRLGLELIKTVLGAPDAHVKLQSRPAWLTADRFAVLTVETEKEIRPVLQPLGVDLIFEKNRYVSTNEEEDPLLPRIIAAVLLAQRRAASLSEGEE